MKDALTAAFAGADDDYRREPTPTEISGGFPCGPADLELFNGLFYRSTQIGIELEALIVAAGLTPDDAVLTQVRDAITALIASGGTPFATRAEVIAGVVTGKSTDPAKLAAAINSGTFLYALAGGTANALTAALAPAPAALVNGMLIVLGVASTNSAAATLNINGLGAKAIVGPDAAALRAGDMVAGETALLVYRSSWDVWMILTTSRLSSQVIGFKASNLGTSLSIPDSTYVTVKPSSLIFDSNSGYSTGTGIYTVPKAGLYSINANFWMPDVAYVSNVYINKNGSRVAESSSNYRGRVMAVSTIENCAASDQLSMTVAQYSGGTITAPTTGYPVTISASLLGNI